MNQNELYVKLLTEARIEVEGGKEFVCILVKQAYRGHDLSVSVKPLYDLLDSITAKIGGHGTAGHYLAKPCDEYWPSDAELKAFRLNMIDELIAKYEQNILFIKLLKESRILVQAGRIHVCNILKELHKPSWMGEDIPELRGMMEDIQKKILGSSTVLGYLWNNYDWDAPVPPEEPNVESIKVFRLKMIDELIESYGGK